MEGSKEGDRSPSLSGIASSACSEQSYRVKTIVVVVYVGSHHCPERSRRGDCGVGLHDECVALRFASLLHEGMQVEVVEVAAGVRDSLAQEKRHVWCWVFALSSSGGGEMMLRPSPRLAAALPISCSLTRCTILRRSIFFDEALRVLQPGGRVISWPLRPSGPQCALELERKDG